METKKNKVVGFVKNHKKQIAIAAGMVAAGGLMLAKTRTKKSINYIECKDLADVKAACSGFDKVFDLCGETSPYLGGLRRQTSLLLRLLPGQTGGQRTFSRVRSSFKEPNRDLHCLTTLFSWSYGGFHLPNTPFSPHRSKVLDTWEETMPHGHTWLNVVIEDLPAYKIEQAVRSVMQRNKDVTPDTVVNAVIGFKVG